MKIPNKLNIMGRTYRVEYDEKGLSDNDDVGKYDEQAGVIYISKGFKELPRCMDSVEQNFLHEVVHGMCWQLGYNQLYNDEKFVEQFSGLLHQIIPQLEDK